MSVTVIDNRGKGKRKAPLPDGTVAPPWWDVFVAIERERRYQIEKWGPQLGTRLDGTGLKGYQDYALEYQRQNDARAEAGKPGLWSKILLEEVFEALSETDPDKLAHELVQVAAVATAWLEDLAWRKAPEPNAAAAA